MYVETVIHSFSQPKKLMDPLDQLRSLSKQFEEFVLVDTVKAFEAATEMHAIASKLSEETNSVALKNKADGYMALALERQSWLSVRLLKNQEGLMIASQSRAIYHRLGDTQGVIKATLHVAGAFTRVGNFANALEEAMAGLDLAQAYGTQLDIAMALSTIAIIYQLLEEYTQPESYALRAMTLIKPIKYLLTARQFTIITQSLALVYYHQKRFDEALCIFSEEVEYCREQKDYVTLTVALDNLGTTLISLNRLDEAEKALTEGVKLARKGRNIYSELTCLTTLGDLEEKRENYESAIAYYNQILEIPGTLSINYFNRTYNSLANAYEKLGKIDLAYTNLKKYSQQRQEALNAETLRRVRNLQVLRETEQTRREASQNAETVLQRNREIELLKNTLTFTNTSSEKQQILSNVCMELSNTLKSALSLAMVVSDNKREVSIEAGFYKSRELNATGLRLDNLASPDSSLLTDLINVQQIVAIDDATTYFVTPSIKLGIQKFRVASMVFLPIVVHKNTSFILVLGFDTRRDFTRADINLASALATSLSQIFENARLYQEIVTSHHALSEAYDATIEGWAKALELRDQETEGHARRVTELTVQLAKAVGMSDEDVVHVRRGALLHDIGKLGIPDSILLKPGKLTPEEFAIMQQHPRLAYDMLHPIPYLQPALDIPYCHHEKWDGTGYPRGLKGEEIPLAARFFALVDVWDALSSDRPYRKRWEKQEIYDHIQSLAGTHFDPKATEIFLNLIRSIQ